MLRSEVDFVRRLISQTVEPVSETNDKRFKAIEKQNADLIKEVERLKKEVEDLKKPKPVQSKK